MSMARFFPIDEVERVLVARLPVARGVHREKVNRFAIGVLLVCKGGGHEFNLARLGGETLDGFAADDVADDLAAFIFQFVVYCDAVDQRVAVIDRCGQLFGAECGGVLGVLGAFRVDENRPGESLQFVKGDRWSATFQFCRRPSSYHAVRSSTGFR